MTTTTELQSGTALTDAQTSGFMTRIFAKALSAMTPQERTDTFKEAVQSSGVELGKAKAMLDPSGSHPGAIEDQWNGPPDATLDVSRVAGHSGNHAGGTVPLGPSQAASGDGAVKMEHQYSQPAPQGGVQLSTERLGRELMKSTIGRTFGTLVKAIELQSNQIEIVKSSIDAHMINIEAVVAKAVADALAKAAPAAAAVAKSETGDAAVEIAKAEDEREDEVEDKEGEKAASRIRVQARNQLLVARQALVKAAEAEDEDKAKEFGGEAAKAVAKAMELAKAAALISPHSVIKQPALMKSIDALTKALPQDQSENQKKWPASEEKGVGKATMTNDEMMAGFAKSNEAIGKALAGVSMLQADLQGFMRSIGGQSAAPGVGPSATVGLPPVYELAKSNPAVLDAKADRITAMLDSGDISMADADSAQDALSRMRAAVNGNIGPEVAQATIRRLPVRVQREIFDVAA